MNVDKQLAALASHGVKGRTLEVVTQAASRYDWISIRGRSGGYLKDVVDVATPTEFRVDAAHPVGESDLWLFVHYAIERSSGWRIVAGTAHIAVVRNAAASEPMADQFVYTQRYNLTRAKDMEPQALIDFIMERDRKRLADLCILRDEKAVHDDAHKAWKDDFHERLDKVRPY